MKTNIYCKFFSAIILISLVLIQTGCIELLELGEVGEVGEFEATLGEIDELGSLRIANPELVAEEITNVKMVEEGELSILKNGKISRFAEVVDNNLLKLENGKTIKLPGVLYSVNEDVFVRQSPFNTSSNILISEHYPIGRLVIVNEEINGWYEIFLPNHEFGFIPVSAVSIVHSKHRNYKVPKKEKQRGFREGVNYIINKAFINTPDAKELIVNITYSDGSFDETSSLKINSIAIEKGYRSTPSFFSKYYYIDELGNQLRLGNLDYIKKLKLYSYADYLLIGNYSSKIRINKLQSNMLTSDLDYTVNLINLKTGIIEKNFSNTIHGTSWTDSQARNDAILAFYEIIKQSKF